MYPEALERLAQLLREPADTRSSVLGGRRIGLERESLRVDENMVIATTDHPAALGAALSHASITTDFSEALVEMVTPPMDSASDALATLEDIHRFVHARLERDETLWSASMPCVLHGDDSIRIGEYGNSPSGRMKHVYRRGLAVRYGRRMQAIAGIHFNFSLPMQAWHWRQGDAEQGSVSSGYFSTMQNLTAIGWIVPYLFGASPAICRTFLAPGAQSDLDTLEQSTRFAPHGTSLRMGNIGYRYKESAELNLSVDHRTLDGWVRDVIDHVRTVHPGYEKLGLYDAEGLRQQLSASRLQIENEYYGTVRPKQIPEDGEMPILALARRGIRYLELRSLDVDPFAPAGLSLETIATLELLMLYAWAADPLPLDAHDIDRIKTNMKTVAHRGREPGLTLQNVQGDIALVDWARGVLEPLRPLAEALDAQAADAGHGAQPDLYRRALQAQLDKVDDPSRLPSARVLAGVREAGSFAEFTAHRSLAAHEELLETDLEPSIAARLEGETRRSRERQRALERAPSDGLDAYLARYFAQLDDWPDGPEGPDGPDGDGAPAALRAASDAAAASVSNA